jgi:hypothetical protein
MTEVKSCNCKHEYQDAVYGKGQRVHNPSTKGHRCSVCGTEKTKPSGHK